MDVSYMHQKYVNSGKLFVTKFAESRKVVFQVGSDPGVVDFQLVVPQGSVQFER